MWMGVVRWGSLFLALVVVVWAATQSQAAPQLILLTVLCMIAVNFSLPFIWGALGLVPVVAVSSLVVAGVESAVFLFLIGFVLAQLAQPLWQPLWENLGIKRPFWREQWPGLFIFLLPLISAAWLYLQTGGSLPWQPGQNLPLAPLVGLTVGYSLAYWGIITLWVVATKRPFLPFLQEYALYLLAVGLLSPPFAALGGLIFANSGFPAFVLFCLGVAGFSIITWLSWQRQFVLHQRLAQFTALNTITASPHALDLPGVLAQTKEQVALLVPSDQLDIYLWDESPPVNDLVAWVQQNGRILDLDTRNIHFATQHNLTLPTPRPSAWLGIPLIIGGQTVGAITLQQFPPSPTFNRWNREILLTIARQTSTAIENVHLHTQAIKHKLAEQEADLTRMVVHDLRNPLTTLVNTLEQSEKDMREQDTTAKTALQDARQICFDMLDMVDSLMDVTRLEAGRLVADVEAMSLPPVLQQIIGRLQPLAMQKNVMVELEPSPANLPVVWADREIMRRVLVNLLDNALKFTPSGGRIYGRFQIEPPLSNQHEPGVRCIISDTGPGIPPEFRQRIFERLVQTESGALMRGTGLGLTFCKLAIEAQNGRIWVEDASNGGSQFIFTLPGIPIWEKP